VSICNGVQHDEDVAKLNHALKQLQDAQQQAQVFMYVCVWVCMCVCVWVCMYVCV